LAALVSVAAGCGGDPASGGVAGGGGMPATGGAGGAVTSPLGDGPPAGNPNGACAVPAEGKPVDVSHPTTVVGTGSPASCTADAFLAAVAKGGIVTFDCGAAPTIIVLPRPAKIVNDASPRTVIDGGGKVTLSGGGKSRILYQNTCDDAQHITSSHCQDQDTPLLVVQNLTLIDGNSTGQREAGSAGGGAIYVRGGKLAIINARFFHNVCEPTGPDLGGGAVRAFSLGGGGPVVVAGSTFGATALGNSGSNGGALSSLAVSWTIVNSLFVGNSAIGVGANPPRDGKPGGGSGGALYADGNKFTVSLCGVKMTDNVANEGGGAIFFVSNDRSGSLVVKDSTLSANPSKGFETDGYPGIFALPSPQASGSTITK
jgi:hypothetical protein